MHLSGGSGVICAKRALPGAVIPAKAGIHFAGHWKYADDGLDSRLRGNDECFERDPIPNDATTLGGLGMIETCFVMYTERTSG